MWTLILIHVERILKVLKKKMRLNIFVYWKKKRILLPGLTLKTSVDH